MDGPVRAPTRHRVEDSDAAEKVRRALVCAACGHVIAPADARTEVGGAHRHTFVNPQGHVFEIGCFAQAPGCASLGDASEFFSWFPGYAWRVGICRGCGVHLGWSFAVPPGPAPDFHGLILERLRESPTTP